MVQDEEKKSLFSQNWIVDCFLSQEVGLKGFSDLLHS